MGKEEVACSSSSSSTSLEACCDYTDLETGIVAAVARRRKEEENEEEDAYSRPGHDGSSSSSGHASTSRCTSTTTSSPTNTSSPSTSSPTSPTPHPFHKHKTQHVHFLRTGLSPSEVKKRVCLPTKGDGRKEKQKKRVVRSAVRVDCDYDCD